MLSRPATCTAALPLLAKDMRAWDVHVGLRLGGSDLLADDGCCHNDLIRSCGYIPCVLDDPATRSFLTLDLGERVACYLMGHSLMARFADDLHCGRMPCAFLLQNLQNQAPRTAGLSQSPPSMLFRPEQILLSS